MDPTEVVMKKIAEIADKFGKSDARVAALEKQIDDVQKRQQRPGSAGSADRDASSLDRVKAAINAQVRMSAAQAEGAPNVKALTNADPETGQMSPSELAPVLETVLKSKNVFRQIAKVVRTNANKFVTLVGQGDQSPVWAAETDARPATTPVSFKAVSIDVNEQYVNVPVSQQLIEDAEYPIGDFVIEEGARQFARAESAAAVSGNAINKPKGFLTHTLSATPTWDQLKLVKSGVAGQVTYDTLMDLVFALPAEYRAGAAFVAHTTALAAIRKLKDSQGQPLWQPGIGATPPQLAGYPIHESADMPAIAAGANCIAFGDWKRGLLIVDRIQTSILVDPFTNKPYVNLYIRRRSGSRVLDSNALAVYQTGV